MFGFGIAGARYACWYLCIAVAVAVERNIVVTAACVARLCVVVVVVLMVVVVVAGGGGESVRWRCGVGRVVLVHDGSQRKRRQITAVDGKIAPLIVHENRDGFGADMRLWRCLRMIDHLLNGANQSFCHIIQFVARETNLSELLTPFEIGHGVVNKNGEHMLLQLGLNIVRVRLACLSMVHVCLLRRMRARLWKLWMDKRH